MTVLTRFWTGNFHLTHPITKFIGFSDQNNNYKARIHTYILCATKYISDSVGETRSAQLRHHSQEVLDEHD